MINIEQIIIVEGKYDKIRLSSFVNATIITTDGFKIFKDKSKINMIKKLADRYGVIILTDSDVAGFKIRNFILGILPKEKVVNVYIPQIQGKEKRKLVPSKENILGVEGIDEKIIIECIKSAGILNKKKNQINNYKQITKLDLYNDGFIGQQNSEKKRQAIKHYLNLPTYISTKALLEILNKLLTYDEYRWLVDSLNI